MSYGTRINQNIQTNAQQNLGYSNQGINYGKTKKGNLYPTRQYDIDSYDAQQDLSYISNNVGTTNQGITYGNRKGNLYLNRANNLLAQYDTDSFDQTYQNGYGYQPYSGSINRQGSADYPNYSDYSDVTLVRSPSVGNVGGGISPCAAKGLVNPLLGLLILGIGFFLTWTNWTKLQAIKAEGRYFSLNSVEHLLEFIWNG